MADVLQFADIDDAVLATYQNLVKKGAFLDMQTDLTDHVAVREMWKEKQKRFDGGNDWEFQIQVDHNHSARAVGMFQTDGTEMLDTLVEGKVQPRHVNAHYIYDMRDKAFQRGGKAIVDLVFSRYVAMMVSFYEVMEGFLWGSPLVTDNKSPHGISFWVQKGSDGDDGSFGGLDPSGYEAVGRANILTSAQPRWANYFADYESVSIEDLVRKMRRGVRQTNFRSPVSHSQPELTAMKNGIYVGDTVIGLMEELLRTQNMNLGNDLAAKDGATIFKGTPITYAPFLDSDSENPIYMLDWKWLTVGVLAGWEENLTAPYMVPGKHLVKRVDLDVTLELICTNLRRQSVYAQIA
ncbi:hypothetical protein LCGC14_1920320 [marine sediment metagenome]|uniref:Phage major capsid protein n=1 Tax=marine sediment metagenome TaxID=412755 RepID=A0A0F9INS5_9ZZZZ